MIEDFDADQSGGDNERGSGGPNFLRVGNEKGGVCSWDYETDNENAEDIEDQDTPESPPNGDWDILPGILGLTDGDTDEFGSHVSEKSVDESGPETKEGGKTLPVGDLGLKVFAHWAIGRIPVTETTGRGGGES